MGWACRRGGWKAPRSPSAAWLCEQTKPAGHALLSRPGGGAVSRLCVGRALWAEGPFTHWERGARGQGVRVDAAQALGVRHSVGGSARAREPQCQRPEAAGKAKSQQRRGQSRGRRGGRAGGTTARRTAFSKRLCLYALSLSCSPSHASHQINNTQTDPSPFSPSSEGQKQSSTPPTAPSSHRGGGAGRGGRPQFHLRRGLASASAAQLDTRSVSHAVAGRVLALAQYSRQPAVRPEGLAGTVQPPVALEVAARVAALRQILTSDPGVSPADSDKGRAQPHVT
eukprot:scaffold17876_cov132-Isochrysis_galbana.AAC.8